MEFKEKKEEEKKKQWLGHYKTLDFSEVLLKQQFRMRRRLDEGVGASIVDVTLTNWQMREVNVMSQACKMRGEPGLVKRPRESKERGVRWAGRRS